MKKNLLYYINIFYIFLLITPYKNSAVYADEYIKVPSLKFSTKAISSLDLDILISDENINQKVIEASIYKQVTKITREFALKQKKSESFDKVLKIACNENTDNEIYYGCVEDNKKASVKNLKVCNLPKENKKYQKSEYFCSGGKRALDIYRITSICMGTFPSDTKISRDTKKEKPSWKLSGEGAEINIKRNGAIISSLPGVYFLTPMQVKKNYINQPFSKLLLTSSSHPALKGFKIIKYNLNISGTIGILEKQSLGKRIKKIADSYCNGGALQMAAAFQVQ